MEALRGPWLPPPFSLSYTTAEQCFPSRHLQTNEHPNHHKKYVPACWSTFLQLRASPWDYIDVRLEGSFGALDQKIKGRSVALTMESAFSNDLVGNKLASSLSIRFESAFGHAAHIPAFELFGDRFALLKYSVGKHFCIGREATKMHSYSQWWIAINGGAPIKAKCFMGIEYYVKRVFNDKHMVLVGAEYWQGFGDHKKAHHPLAAKHFSFVDGVLSYRYSLTGLGSVALTLRHRFEERYTPTLPLGVELRVDIPFSI